MTDISAPHDVSDFHRGQVAPGKSVNATDNSWASKIARSFRPTTLIIAFGILLIVAIAVGTGFMLSNLRSRALAESEREIQNVALVLAKQMERDFDAVRSVQNRVIESIQARGIASSEAFEQEMSDYQTHLLLKDRVVGFPYLGALGSVFS